MDTDLPAIAKALRALDKTDVRNWLRRGELLTQAKDLNGNDTRFGRWCREQHIARTTAYKSIAAWRHFGSVPTSGQFSKEAMAMLAQSPEARTEAIAIADRQKITARIARQLVQKHASPAHVETPTLADVQAGRFHERFTVEGDFTVTITGPGQPTTTDLLGVLMHVQRKIRDRMMKAA